MLFDHIEDEGLRAKTQEAHDTAMNTFKEEMSSTIQSEIDKAVTGLKSKNDELLTEKKTIQEALKNFDGLDAAKAKEALEFINNNEDAQLIKDGKIDELLDRRTSAMKSDHESIVGDLTAQVKELAEGKSKYKTQFQNKMIDDAIRDAALTGKIRPEAISDVILRSKSVFSLADDLTVESRDSKGNLNKIDDKVLTPTNWIESLKKTSPHYWPASEGAGANSGGFGGGDDLDTRINEAAAKGNMSEYRRLKAKKK